MTIYYHQLNQLSQASSHQLSPAPLNYQLVQLFLLHCLTTFVVRPSSL